MRQPWPPHLKNGFGDLSTAVEPREGSLFLSPNCLVEGMIAQTSKIKLSGEPLAKLISIAGCNKAAARYWES
jgi:hypothetical protein